MESNLNESKISVLFGDDFGDHDYKSSFEIAIDLNKDKAIQQANSLKALALNQVETNNSLVFVFPCAQQDEEKLTQLLTSVFDGSAKTKMGDDLASFYSAGKIKYQVINAGGKIILAIRAGSDIEPLILGQINQILDMGAKDIVEKQQNKITISGKSLSSFGDINDLMGEGNTFFSALLKSLRLDLILSIDQNLLTRVIQLAQALDPRLEQSPLALIQYFKSFDIELKFNGTDDLPNQIRTHLYKNQLQRGLVVSSAMGENDKVFWKDFAKVLNPGTEVFITLENIAAVHIKSNLPEFSKHFLRELN